jgi:hypothetical protein
VSERSATTPEHHYAYLKYIAHLRVVSCPSDGEVDGLSN